MLHGCPAILVGRKLLMCPGLGLITGNEARPFIISPRRMAGTQRYAEYGLMINRWCVEYIRFHIPTYIGSGFFVRNAKTFPDMDGIFGGRNAVLNMRDFQWKTFTPMQLNMDGWGATKKYPHALGEPATSYHPLVSKA